LVDEARAVLARALRRIDVPVEIEEIEGEFASPTLLVDGADVTGRSTAPAPSCRLDVPTEEQVLAALRRCVGECS
jgi:hypothetical protein